MKKTLDTVLRVMAFVSLFVFGIMAAAVAMEGNTQTAYAYLCAAAWAVIYLVMGEEDPWT